MMVAVLVIGYVLVLRYFDQKNRERDRIKLGDQAPSGPPDYAALQQALARMSDQLTQLEAQYGELARRLEVTQ
jgi:hypothetical protein